MDITAYIYGSLSTVLVFVPSATLFSPLIHHPPLSLFHLPPTSFLLPSLHDTIILQIFVSYMFCRPWDAEFLDETIIST